jgi:hypothetical protein
MLINISICHACFFVPGTPCKTTSQTVSSPQCIPDETTPPHRTRFSTSPSTQMRVSCNSNIWVLKDRTITLYKRICTMMLMRTFVFGWFGLLRMFRSLHREDQIAVQFLSGAVDGVVDCLAQLHFLLWEMQHIFMGLVDLTEELVNLRFLTWTCFWLVLLHLG